MLYSQTDPRVKWMKLGSSGLLVKDFGCTSMCVVNGLNAAGYNVTPEEFVQKMNANGGYTSGGLLKWGVATSLYPQFKYPGSGYQFVIGTWGRYHHWIIRFPDGKEFDPFYGVFGRPAGYKEVERRNIGFAPAPNPAPVPSPTIWDVKVTADKLNVRSVPTTKDNTPLADKQLSKGDVLPVKGEVRGNDGNIWLNTANSNLFIWKGGTVRV